MKKLFNASFGLMCLTVFAGSAVATPIGFPPVEVTSLEHSYTYKEKTSGPLGTITDYFNLSEGIGSGVTTPFTVDLSTADTTISISLAAPAGKKFVFTVPSGATSARLRTVVMWTSHLSSPTTYIDPLNIAFEGLSGTTPLAPPTNHYGGGYFGADYLTAEPTLSGITQNFEFTALRVDFDVPSGGLASSSKTYDVQGALLEAYASAVGLTDQIILSIEDAAVTPDTTIPTPGALLLAGIGAGLVGWLRRRATL